TSTILINISAMLIASIATVGCKPPVVSSGLSEENSADAISGKAWPFLLRLDTKGSITLSPPSGTSSEIYISNIEMKPIKETSEISADKEQYTKPLAFQNIKVVDQKNLLIAFSKGEVLLGNTVNGSSLTYEEACEFENR